MPDKITLRSAPDGERVVAVGGSCKRRRVEEFVDLFPRYFSSRYKKADTAVVGSKRKNIIAVDGGWRRLRVEGLPAERQSGDLSLKLMTADNSTSSRDKSDREGVLSSDKVTPDGGSLVVMSTPKKRRMIAVSGGWKRLSVAESLTECFPCTQSPISKTAGLRGGSAVDDAVDVSRSAGMIAIYSADVRRLQKHLLMMQHVWPSGLVMSWERVE